MAQDGRLKLAAKDAADMDVIAALLQDALVPLPDVAFQKRPRRFVAVANRFKWRPEDLDEVYERPAVLGRDARFEDAKGDPPYERTRAGLRFERVRRVQTRGIDRLHKAEILNLLTINTEPGVITLLFSDDRAIRLEVDEIRCYLEDIGGSWPTRWRPRHDDTEPGEAAED